jgi:hypothetical protein
MRPKQRGLDASGGTAQSLVHFPALFAGAAGRRITDQFWTATGLSLPSGSQDLAAPNNLLRCVAENVDFL